MNIQTLTKEQLAGMFDHTNLHPDATKEDMKKLCDEAKSMKAAMVAINPYWTSFCKEELDGTAIHVGAAIGFPLGQNTLETKVFETKDALEKGADEIDYVVNLSKVKEKDWDYIEKEMRDIVALCKEYNAVSKVILENCYLEWDEIIALCKIARRVGIDFVKTSTGKGTYGARVEDVALMKEIVEDACQVKAAGGIRDWPTCKAMIEAGATRIGTSSSLKILEEFEAETGAGE